MTDITGYCQQILRVSLLPEFLFQYCNGSHSLLKIGARRHLDLDVYGIEIKVWEQTKTNSAETNRNHREKHHQKTQ